LLSLTSLASRGRPKVIVRAALEMVQSNSFSRNPFLEAELTLTWIQSSRLSIYRGIILSWSRIISISSHGQSMRNRRLVCSPANALWILCWVSRPEPLLRTASGPGTRRHLCPARTIRVLQLHLRDLNLTLRQPWHLDARTKPKMIYELAGLHARTPA
jgi:hypothetical protein